MTLPLNRELRKIVTPEYITGDNSRIFAGRYAHSFYSKRVLLATDERLLDMDWMNGITDSLSEGGAEYEFFTGISENPRDYDVIKGAEVYRAEECTGIVAVGGGSIMDCSKGIGIISANGGKISDYIGVDRVKNPMPPLICIPTTGGSSADVSQYAVITCPEKREKNLIISKSLVPDVSLLDPVPLATQPDEITVYSAIDALSHAIEAYVSNGSSYISDILALEAVRILGEVLPYDPAQRENTDFRFKTLIASLCAGISFSNAGLGLIHSLSHAFGGMYDMPHGLSSAIVMPFVVRYNFSSAPGRYRKIAEAIMPDSKGIPDEKIPDALIEKVLSMYGEYQKYPDIKSFGASYGDIPDLVKRAVVDPCIATNPRLPPAEDIKKLIIKIFDSV
jgi:alcohol dehydrogenase